MQTLQSLNRKRICAYCKKKLNISTISDVQETVLCQNKYYHTNCFKEMCIKKSKERKKNGELKNTSLKYLDMLNHINEYVEAVEYKMVTSGIIHKDLLNYFLCDHYGLLIIPSSFWTKIEQIRNGTWKSLIIGIPVEDILGMWEMYVDELDKIAYYNKSHGKEMTSEQRLNYDLAILLNKYNEYKEKKRKEDLEVIRIQEEINNTNEYERTKAWLDNYYKRQAQKEKEKEDAIKNGTYIKTQEEIDEELEEELDKELWGEDE